MPRCATTPAGPELSSRVVVDRERLRATVARLADEIAEAHPDGVVLVSILKGSLIFLADLARKIPAAVPVELDFMAISSYAPDTGRVRIVKDLSLDIHGREVVLVEDIVDTGLTLAYVVGELARRGPASLEVCTLLDKAVRRLVPTPLRYVGVEVGDEFLIGYGLDHAELYRNVDHVLAADLSELVADRTAKVQELYGRSGGRVYP